MFVIVSISLLTAGPLAAQTAQDLAAMQKINPRQRAPLAIENGRLEAHNIRSEVSDHLWLMTDINGEEQVDDLNQVFDAAVPHWCEYFGIDVRKAAKWRMRGMVIADRERFVDAGLFPDSLPEFPTGYQLGHEMWIYLQPGDYYTRHLLLHEGTHAFMQWFLDGVGAPWYSEGMAELLGLHSWQQGTLKMNFRLTARRQAAYWGRIKIIKQECRDGEFLELEQVFDLPANAFRSVKGYAWSWAACEFLSTHPQSKKAFADLKRFANLPPGNFNAKFIRSLGANRKSLARDWRLFVHEIDFGYDVAGCVVGNASAATAAEEKAGQFEINTLRGWQKTSLKVQSGERFAFQSDGRFVVGREDGEPWPCESNGITIEYYRGQPLGSLMVGVLGADNEIEHLLDAQPTSQVYKCPGEGTLCFRINEFPGRLQDNEGTISVKVKRVEQ